RRNHPRSRRIPGSVQQSAPCHDETVLTGFSPSGKISRRNSILVSAFPAANINGSRTQDIAALKKSRGGGDRPAEPGRETLPDGADSGGDVGGQGASAHGRHARLQGSSCTSWTW